MKPSAPVGPVEFSDIQKTSVVITWKPSENDGGSPITGYYIEMREAPKSSWQRVTTVSPDITSYCVQNVKEKKDYFFKIYAENLVGRSDALASDGVTIKSPFGKIFSSSFRWLVLVAQLDAPLTGGQEVTALTVMLTFTCISYNVDVRKKHITPSNVIETRTCISKVSK